ncbi:MAG TPA: hypothetical protein VHC97_05215 [Thermoanaerobaculia bacterium]|jgi:hypothetical protein|nr:hypothetical protein [Thermoanaerobaculia bacterium]
MKKNAKLSLNRETLRMLTLDGHSLQKAVGATSEFKTRCDSVCNLCNTEYSVNAGCHNT